MQRSVRIIRLVFILLALYSLTVLAFQRQSGLATADFADTLSADHVSLSGQVELDLAVFPAILTPGDTATLTIALHNGGAEAAMPTVIVQLPPGLSVDARALPMATSLNMQTGSLVWQPTLAANERRQLTAAMRVNVADVAQPHRSVTATIRLNGEEQTADAALWVGMPPQAQISFSPQRTAVGQPVQLLAQTSGPGPFSQLWELGDGRTVDADSPTVVFPVPGSYEIKLHIANPLTTVTVSGRMTVAPEPAAAFEPARSSVGVNQPLVFRNLSGGQPPLAYSWDFGDGQVSDQRQPTHAYQQPGLYQARLVVENEYGRDEISWPVRVGDPPVADMIIDPAGRAGEPLRGQAFGDETVTAFEWQMGDGRTASGEFIDHLYRAGGDYWVTLTAVNDFGTTEIGRWVVIEPGDSYLYLPLVIAADPLDPAFDHLSVDPDLTLFPLPRFTQETLEPLDLPVTTAPAEKLFYYINAARRQNGLPSLEYAHELTVAAQRHTEDMAVNHFTSHTGSDGSSPALRFLIYGYQGGYIGEATAWGMERAIEAVEFWLNSPSHRRILLNQSATEVGVGYTVSFTAPNVWYWTAEFGNPSLPPPVVEMPAPTPIPNPVIQLLNPVPETYFTTGLAPLTFSWRWPNSLEADEQFVVYLIGVDGRLLPLGSVFNPVSGDQYQLVVPGGNLPPGVYDWQAQLQSRADGRSRLTSENWSLNLLRAGEEPPPPASVPVETPTATPPGAPAPSPTPQPTQPTQPLPTPLPTVAPLPTTAP